MPLRFVRSKVSGVDTLQAAISTTAFTKELVATMQFPPATAAISILLLIFETIQSIQTNRSACDRLARRAAQILIDIDNQMRGRYDSAPELLVRNLKQFECTLKSIYDFMRKLADSKWSDRFLRKNSFEDALSEYTRMLEEAAQSFQIATLIDIHYAVSSLSRQADARPIAQQSVERVVESPPAYMKTENEGSSILGANNTAEPLATSFSHSPSGPLASPRTEEPIPEIITSGAKDSINDHYLPAELCSLTLEDDHGVRHKFSHVCLALTLQFSSRSFGAIINQRFCFVAVLASRMVGGQGQWKLRYRVNLSLSKNMMQWLRDVKMLQNLYHPNLPQMIGFSDERVLTPFILLSNVRTQSPEVIVRETLRSASLATCMELMLRFYRDLSDTAMYVQRQLSLSESQVQDFFEASKCRVDSHKTIVVGLPPPREGTWYSARNYGLAHTILNTCLNMLPNNGRVTYSYDKGDDKVAEDMQKKVNHLVTLARALLPSGSRSPELAPELQRFIDDNDFEAPSITLRQVRDLTFDTDGHNHSWYERNVPAGKFSVGDLGYLPPGKGWDSFVRLLNVANDGLVKLQTSSKSIGEHWCWEEVPIRRQPLQAFEMPGNINGWPVAVPSYKQIDVAVIHETFMSVVKDAWRYLLENGNELAREAGVKPEDLILVTHAGTHQDFYIKDFRPKPFGMDRQLIDPRFAANSFHGAQNRGFGSGNFAPHSFNEPVMPSIFYLFTSSSASHEPYWSSSPMCVPPGAERPPLNRNFTSKIGCKTGFLNYVQLYSEDFDCR
ncbi:hypothetical protein F5I97DRAFT_1817508 [Phlebopus sp. FC_14]|nr:hypothetical protein F5I97DRAFT_1817508 [Phlebopus sp. FC_14]